MDLTNRIIYHDQFAKSYDSQVKEYHSHGHDVLFGMCYEYVKPGESLLDLGIGTGLSSIHFAKAGLEITGLDGSSEMLKVCRKKSFAKELVQYNIQEVPLPYLDNSFSHVICCGVFHFFSDLLPIIRDSFRLLKTGGIFAFTIAVPTTEEVGSNPDIDPNYIESPTSWGIWIFKHTDRYINSIAETLGLLILKEQIILLDSGDKETADILSKVIIMRKETS